MGKKHLTLEKREILARLLSEGMSIRNIAHILGFSPSAISQEVRRNSLKDGRYVPKSAQEKARIRRLRANRERQPVDTALYAYIKEKLSFCWSPEQIVGRLRKDFPTAHRMRISFKTIYNKICPAKGAPRTDFVHYKQYLRRKHARTRSFRHGKSRSAAEVNRTLPSIEQRPSIVDERARFGDWEGDLISGKRGTGFIATFVERLTGLTLAYRCKDKSKATVSHAMECFMKDVPGDLRKTMTLDRGTEFFGYEGLELKYETKFYFCHPQCPQERGLNENTNGLLRQFFPRKMDFREISDFELKHKLRLLADRPRKKFGYSSTIEKLQQLGLEGRVQF